MEQLGELLEQLRKMLEQLPELQEASFRAGGVTRGAGGAASEDARGSREATGAASDTCSLVRATSATVGELFNTPDTISPVIGTVDNTLFPFNTTPPAAPDLHWRITGGISVRVVLLGGSHGELEALPAGDHAKPIGQAGNTASSPSDPQRYCAEGGHRQQHTATANWDLNGTVYPTCPRSRGSPPGVDEQLATVATEPTRTAKEERMRSREQLRKLLADLAPLRHSSALTSATVGELFNTPDTMFPVIVNVDNTPFPFKSPFAVAV